MPFLHNLFIFEKYKSHNKPVQGIHEEYWRPGTVTGPKNWKLFSSMLKESMISKAEINDIAVFLYCKLNQSFTN